MRSLLAVTAARQRDEHRHLLAVCGIRFTVKLDEVAFFKPNANEDVELIGRCEGKDQAAIRRSAVWRLVKAPLLPWGVPKGRF